jgi:hypothetical protein
MKESLYNSEKILEILEDSLPIALQFSPSNAKLFPKDKLI